MTVHFLIIAHDENKNTKGNVKFFSELLLFWYYDHDKSPLFNEHTQNVTIKQHNDLIMLGIPVKRLPLSKVVVTKCDTGKGKNKIT